MTWPQISPCAAREPGGRIKIPRATSGPHESSRLLLRGMKKESEKHLAHNQSLGGASFLRLLMNVTSAQGLLFSGPPVQNVSCPRAEVFYVMFIALSSVPRTVPCTQ